MKRIKNIFTLLFFTTIYINVAYPCMNCAIPIANAGDAFNVINGGAGILNGTGSYDPDNFDLELTYLWYSDEDIISYCGKVDADECSEKKYYCRSRSPWI